MKSMHTIHQMTQKCLTKAEESRCCQRPHLMLMWKCLCICCCPVPSLSGGCSHSAPFRPLNFPFYFPGLQLKNWNIRGRGHVLVFRVLFVSAAASLVNTGGRGSLCSPVRFLHGDLGSWSFVLMVNSIISQCLKGIDSRVVHTLGEHWLFSHGVLHSLSDLSLSVTRL